MDSSRTAQSCRPTTDRDAAVRPVKADIYQGAAFEVHERASFGRVLERTPVPDMCLARHLVAAWRDDYNRHRTHSSLDGLTPRDYHKKSNKDQTLNRADIHPRTPRGAGHVKDASHCGLDRS